MRRVLLCLFFAGGCGIEAFVGDENDGKNDFQPWSELDPAQSELDRVYCVAEINRYRATLQLPPVERSSEMEAFADVGASIDGYHEEPHHHFTTTTFPGAYTALAENEARNWNLHRYDTVQDILRLSLAQMWAEGPGGGHYENMIGNYTQVGCGLYLDVPTQNITAVQDFRLP